MDLTFKSEGGCFNCRAAGVAVHDGRLLVMKDGGTPFHYLPGGRVLLHESSEDAVLREIREELGTAAEIGRLLWVVESFFRAGWIPAPSRAREFHEIGFYYLLNLPDQFIKTYGNDFIMTEPDGARHHFFWVSLESLRDLYFEPDFLKERLAKLPGHAEHIIRREAMDAGAFDEIAGSY